MDPRRTKPIPKLKLKSHKNDTHGGIMQFIGPAQKPFVSFMELARFALDSYLAKWIDPWEPLSYISPPTFNFKNPDKSDWDIAEQRKLSEEMKKMNCANKEDLSKLGRPSIDRWSDDGEYVVFQALWKLVQKNVQAPFLAVRGLNLEKLKDYLQQIFPEAQRDLQGRFEKTMREYDFVLIGPRIGVIVVEVKSSSFTKQKDFSATNDHLADHIVDGVKQLNSFDLEFFRECALLQSAFPVPLRKILFTPNLEKHRMEEWYNNLEQIAKDKVDKYLNGVTHWFRDDMVNLPIDSLRPALYTSIRQVIEADGFQLPTNLYELYGPIFVGLGSAWIIKSQQLLVLREQRLSTSAAILRDADALERQDFKQQDTHLPNFDEKAKLALSSKMVLLTPVQQKALNGQNFQFIIGAAGTGKTTILQAKAVEMLGKGKSVLVFATRNFGQRYRKLFDDHGFTNYEVRSITDLAGLFCTGFYQAHELTSVMKDLDLDKPVRKVLDHLVSLSDTSAIQGLMNNILTFPKFDAIFIDDAVDKAGQGTVCGQNVLVSFALFAAMAVGKRRYGSKMLWVALDPVLNPEPSILGDWSISMKNKRFYKRVLEQISELENDYFSYSCLQQVMRCSEGVFQSAYCHDILEEMVVKPILGHKIPGFSDSVHLNFFEESTPVQIKLVLWEQIERALDRFLHEGFDYGQMAVITGSLGYSDGDGLAGYLSKKSIESGIPTTDDVDHFPSDAADGKLVISSWRCVSSLEWPVVIYVFTANKNYCDDEKSVRLNLLSGDFKRYRACSRATMRLFQVIVHYDLNKRSWEADVCKRNNGRYTMAPSKQKAKEDIHVSNTSETVDQLAMYTTRSDRDLLEYPGDQNLFWKRTLRRSFSVHTLDLSRISDESEIVKTEKGRQHRKSH